MANDRFRGKYGRSGEALAPGREGDLYRQETPVDRFYQCGTDQLLLVINDSLDFSRIEAGKLVLEPEEFALRDALGDTLRSLALRAVERELELAYRVSPEVPDCLLCDLGRLRQLLVNLVGNALKFTSKGEVLLEVTTEPSGADGGDNLHFCVSDTGMGIATEQQRRIFELFTQVEGSTALSFGGTGLGLAICRQLVAMMQGRLWVDSEPGRGSRFHFTLPLRRGSGQVTVVHELPGELRDLPVLVVHDNATNRRILFDLPRSWGMSPVPRCRSQCGPRSRCRSGPTSGPVPCLVVDDGAAYQMVAMAMLEKRGHRVTIASDGRQAIELAAERRFGVILMDVQMPGLDDRHICRSSFTQWVSPRTLHGLSKNLSRAVVVIALGKGYGHCRRTMPRPPG